MGCGAYAQPLDIQGKRLTWRAGSDYQLRISAGGQHAVSWDNKFASRYELLALAGNHSTVVDGPGDGPLAQPLADGFLVLGAGSKVFTCNLRPMLANALKGNILLACEDPRFFLTVHDKPGTKSTADIYTTADRRLVYTLDDLEPITSATVPNQRGHVAGEPRLRYLPAANLVVVLPETNDRLVLRSFDLPVAQGARKMPFLTAVRTLNSEAPSDRLPVTTHRYRLPGSRHAQSPAG